MAEKEKERLQWQTDRVKGLDGKGGKRNRGEMGIVTRLKRKLPCFTDMDFELEGLAGETVKLLHRALLTL